MTISHKIIGGIGVAIIAMATMYVVFPQKSFSQALTMGRLGAKCTISATTTVNVGHQASTRVLPAYSNRAWATIQLPKNDAGVASNTVSINFDASSTLASGYQLSTTSNEMTFGLNTVFPFVGEVNAITSTGSTTLRVTECRYY